MISSQGPSFGTRQNGSVKWWFPALLVAAGLTASAEALAQGFGPDPYRPYNSQYDSFVYPVAPGPLDYGQNQSPLRSGVRGANQFENYMNSLMGPGAGRAPSGGVGSPYYRGANRVTEREGMNYQPNREIDAKFDSSQEMVSDLYFKYLRERDPKKRSELFRQYNRARNRVDRDLASPRSASSRAGARTTRRAGGAASAETPEGADRGTADRLPTDRRSGSAPPPLPSSRVRSRTGAGDTGDLPTAGPAPPPLLRRSERGSSAADELLPSQVLDRADRLDRSRVGPRVRVPLPSAVTPRNP
jgi:hypothetical protein